MFMPDPGSKFFLPGSRSQRSQILDPGSEFFSIPDPRVKKAPDPGSGTATLPPPTKYRTKDAELLGLPC